jgi:hypothetical protein
MTDVAAQGKLDPLGEDITILQVMDLARLEVEVDNDSGGAGQCVPASLASTECSQLALSNLICSRRWM